jgi:hypothetical protein
LLRFLALSHGRRADYVGPGAGRQPPRLFCRRSDAAIRVERELPPLDRLTLGIRRTQQMTLLSTLRARTQRGDVAHTIFRYGPAAAALVYPLLLMFLHRSGRQLVEATAASGKLSAGLGVGIAAALVSCVPLLSFFAIWRSAGEVRTRRRAHLAFAAPPLFTLAGVLFFLLGIPNGEYAVWVVAWVGVLAYAAWASPQAGSASARRTGLIRAAHGFSAAIIVVSFLLWHLANHVLAIQSLDQHKAAMDVLRVWYRSDVVQPILVALFAWQLVSGLRLLWAKLPSRGDIYSSIQTATAAYLAVYIPSPLIAVFILGRWFLAVDTTFAWASGAPTGLLLDPWNVRLIPHYSLAVLFLIGHLAVGLRTVLLSRGVRPIIADRVTWTICSAGLAVSLAITVAQLRVRG